MTDQLEWLRGLEQDVQRLRRYTNVGNAITADNLAVSLKVKINARIIEVLKEDVAHAVREQKQVGV